MVLHTNIVVILECDWLKRYLFCDVTLPNPGIPRKLLHGITNKEKVSIHGALIFHTFY